MKRCSLLTALVMIILPAIASAQAPLTVDVAKISCDQFVTYKITDPRYIGAWFSGYYSAKRGVTVVDLQGLEVAYTKLRNYCVVNPTVTVMQAVEKLFEGGK
jgi:acid stress chaperone HdeB